MTHEKVLKAEAEAKRFLEAVDEYKKSREVSEEEFRQSLWGTRWTGEVKHSSMLLTRALSAMRRPGIQ